jgi:aspartyl-tRNA synthetase
MANSIFKTSMRTNLCGEIKKDSNGKGVALCGWVNKRRDHGKLIFVDLRDFSGLVQLVFDPNKNKSSYEVAKDIRNEYVIKINGKVRMRSKDTINALLPTGEMEILVEEIMILNRSRTPPFMLDNREKVDENKRLKYRYIDLRDPYMQDNIRLRHNITAATRQYLNSQGFLEIETPIMAKSTPEGARDFLVPSRLNPGKFYALPQSPQLFKQILMVSGFDRCYQIARCFRDEDLRSDRQPEFTQIDLEMTFVESGDVIKIIEGLISHIFKKIFNKKIKLPFKRIKWKESIELYGTDKPDLRFGLEIKDISDVFKGSGIKIFSDVLKNGGCIKSIVVDDASDLGRKELDDLVEMAKKNGAGGLVWIRVGESMSLQSPITKFLSDSERELLISSLKLKEKNLVLIVADDFLNSCRVLGILRKYLGGRFDIVNKDKFEFIWVCDFPLFEWDDNEKRLVPMHHPFTAPDEATKKFLDSDPLKVNSLVYDIVLNGEEIGGGSIRINDIELQKKIFKVLNLDDESIKRNFGFFIRSLEYGAPPHGGIALGMDRLIMMLAGLGSIREVIAFPKTQSAVCLLTDSPSIVSKGQLKEISIDVIEDSKE